MFPASYDDDAGKLASNMKSMVDESEACSSAKVQVRSHLFPPEMMHDSVWIDRLNYEEAEADYQIFLSECVKKSVSMFDMQTQTEPEVSVNQQTDDKNATFPTEMMYDSVWVNRLAYEEAEANCHLFLSKQLTQLGSDASENDEADSELVFHKYTKHPCYEFGSQPSTEANRISEQANNKRMFPIEMMYDSVWMNRLGYDEAAGECQLHFKQVMQPDVVKEDLDLQLEFNEETGKPLCEVGVQTTSIPDRLVEELMSDPNTIHSIQIHDFNELKTAVINLTKFVSALSKENIKLKNRITNSEARMDKMSKNHTPQPKSVGDRVEKLEANVQSMEQMIIHLNSQQLNAMQLDQVKQQLLLVFHRGNQNIMEMIRKLEGAQQVDKVQFDGAMKSLRNYLQHKDAEHKKDLNKLKLELEGFVAKNTQGVDELVKRIKQQQEVSEEARIRYQKRIEEIEKVLKTKSFVSTIKEKENITNIASYPSSVFSVSDEKPASNRLSSNSSVTSSLDMLNIDSSGVDMIGYLGKANEYLEYFQRTNGVDAFINEATAGCTKTAVPETKPVTSWTKATECLPIVTMPGFNYSVPPVQTSSAQSNVKSMFNGPKLPTSVQNSDAMYVQLSKELKQLLSNLPDKCILLAQLPGKYQAQMRKTFPLQTIEIKGIFKKYCPNIRIIGKEENALVLYIDPDNYPSHLLVNQCLNILSECETFSASGEEISEVLLMKCHAKVKVQKIFEEARKHTLFFQVNKNFVRLTQEARCMLLRHSIAMLLKENKNRIMLSDIGNKLSKKIGWTFCLKEYEYDSMKGLFESFGPRFLLITGTGLNKQFVELGPIGLFYCELKTVLQKNGGALPLQALKGKYTEQFQKELVFSRYGFSKVDEFAVMFPTHFKIYGEKVTRTLALNNTLMNSVMVPDPSTENIVALDCEMVGVRGKDGNQIGRAGRCSIVNYNLQVVYDKYIKPEEKIIDYRTKYSGIKKQHLESASTSPFKVAREEIMRILKGKIIVGHSLHNDLDSIKFSWPRVNRRDLSTCPLQHSKTTTSLKELTATFLKREIQKGSHCSLEDAIASMELYKLVQVEWEKECNKK